MAGSYCAWSAGAFALRSESDGLTQPHVHRNQTWSASGIARENLLARRRIRVEPAILRVDEARLTEVRGDARPRRKQGVPVDVLANRNIIRRSGLYHYERAQAHVPLGVKRAADECAMAYIGGGRTVFSGHRIRAAGKRAQPVGVTHGPIQCIVTE